MVPRIVRAAPHAVILVVTDPPDPLADIARAGAGHDRVLSTGTFLDSLRFRVHLAEHFNVDANQVEAQVIREHGSFAGVSLVKRSDRRRTDWHAC
jgi:L-lactate dehydrogenase